MKKSIILFFVFFICLSCYAQIIVDEVKSNEDLYNILANIDLNNTTSRNVNGNYVIVYSVFDPRSESVTEGTHEKTKRILISISNDGEYIQSKCYMHKGLLCPEVEIIERNVKENLTHLNITHGPFDDRKNQKIELSGVDL